MCSSCSGGFRTILTHRYRYHQTFKTFFLSLFWLYHQDSISVFSVNESIHNFLNRDETTASSSKQNSSNVQEVPEQREALTPHQDLLSPDRRGSIASVFDSPASVRSLSRQSQSLRVASRLSQVPRSTSRLSQRSIKLNRRKTMF